MRLSALKEKPKKRLRRRDWRLRKHHVRHLKLRLKQRKNVLKQKRPVVSLRKLPISPRRKDLRPKELNKHVRKPKKSPVANVNKLRMPRKPLKRPLYWQKKKDSKQKRPIVLHRKLLI